MKKGSTRIVFFAFGYAIKVPRFDIWKNFLWGLLANIQEKEFSKLKDERLCPISFYLPLGFLVIMPKCEGLTKEEYEMFGNDFFTQYTTQNPCILPVENKLDSFGWLKVENEKKLVALDYG